VLTEAGLVVGEAENGRAGVELARREAFDVVLMDMQMPVMDGYTATRTLRADGLEVPIFALTANAMKGFEKDVLEAGCTGLLVKPVDIDALMETLAALLGGTRVEREAGAATAAAPAAETRAPAPTEISGAPVRSRLAGNARLRPAIRKFAGRLNEQLLSFDKAYAAKNFEELAQLAHWLKGAGGTVGYDEFTEPALRLEQAAKESADTEAKAWLAEVRSLATRIEVPADEGAAPVTA
jgi:CheY-like chemotaxis protein